MFTKNLYKIKIDLVLGKLNSYKDSWYILMPIAENDVVVISCK